jgi:lysophospholipase L1-like esterase
MTMPHVLSARLLAGLRPHRHARIAAAVLVPAALVVSLFSAPSAQASVALPNSMSALGDSITTAADACCWYGDHPDRSWSTGYVSDGIYSHYERIKAVHPAITGHAHNDAVDGAKAINLQSQVSAAVAQKAGYVTILIGGNDLCTSSPATMTSTTDFATRVQTALATLHQYLPNARIFVSSIPDIYQLWYVLHTNLLARFVWSAAHICQSMLAESNTEVQRQAVVARESAFNQILADSCAVYVRCRWDGYAVYNHKFSATEVSKLDYFHPSLSGQAALAQVTWQASWWGS